MTTTEDIDRLIDAWEAGIFTSTEFQDKLMTVVWALPAAEKRAALQALAAHLNEDVRHAARELQVFARHEALSRDFDYVRANSPLRPGVRLELFGGYDYYSTEGKPWWLNGHECYRAIFLGFASFGENAIPAGLVEFDEAIDLPGHKGRFGVLRTSYDSHTFAWGEAEGVVAVHVREALPEDLASIRSSLDLALAAETHASYRVEQAS